MDEFCGFKRGSVRNGMAGEASRNKKVDSREKKPKTKKKKKKGRTTRIGVNRRVDQGHFFCYFAIIENYFEILNSFFLPLFFARPDAPIPGSRPGNSPLGFPTQTRRRRRIFFTAPLVSGKINPGPREKTMVRACRRRLLRKNERRPMEKVRPCRTVGVGIFVGPT